MNNVNVLNVNFTGLKFIAMSCGIQDVKKKGAALYATIFNRFDLDEWNALRNFLTYLLEHGYGYTIRQHYQNIILIVQLEQQATPVSH